MATTLAAGATGVQASSGATRWAGLAGLGFAVSVVLENVFIGAAGIRNGPGTPAERVLESVTQYGDAYGVLFAWVALTVVLLAVFVAGAYARLREAAPVLATVGLVGGVLLSALFPLSNAPMVALVVAAKGLAGNLILVELLQAMHLAIFAFAGIALGVALFGYSLASVSAGLAPGWFRIVGPVAALVMIGGSAPIKAVAEGVPATLVSLLGFLVWLAFVAILGFRMWREAARGDVSPNFGSGGTKLHGVERNNVPGVS